MITTKKIIVGLATGSLLMGSFTPSAFAASTPQTISDVITQADQSIALRISALNSLNDEVQVMSNVSAAAKTNTSSGVKAQIAGLTALKAKIDADTDISIARTDAQSVFTTFDVYSLVIPQGYLLVSADRINTIGTLMTALATKLSGRIAQGTIAGLNLTQSPKTIADIASKIKDAVAHATLATNGISYLALDNGNLTVASTNKGALIAARSNIGIATADLVSARQDIGILTASLQSLSGSTSTSTQAQ